MVPIFLGCASIACSLAACGLPFYLEPSTQIVVVSVFLHILSSLLMSATFYLMAAKSNSLSFLFFVFSFCFFLPILGSVGLCLGVLPQLRNKKPNKTTGYLTLFQERVHSRHPIFSDRYSPGGFRSRIKQPDIDSSKRLTQLMVLSRRKIPASNPILRNLLSDPNDEIRLAAYSILDSREKKWHADFISAEALQAQASGPTQKAKAWKNLAHLHWESVYQELTEGELANRHLEKAMEAIHQAESFSKQEDALLLLKARILLRSGHAEAAKKIFFQLSSASIPAQRIQPYLAEAAFQCRHFSQVASYLQSLNPDDCNASLEKVRLFWKSPKASHVR
jgi:polysaccharide biosynthesis protein PelE